jgi:hypothetical protein
MGGCNVQNLGSIYYNVLVSTIDAITPSHILQLRKRNDCLLQEPHGCKTTPLCSAKQKSESRSHNRRDSSPGGSITHAASASGWHKHRNSDPDRHARTQTGGEP